MDSIHAGISHIGRESGASITGAAKQLAKELVQMCQEKAVPVSMVNDARCKVNSLLIACVIVGRHVLHQWCCTPTVEKVDGGGPAVNVGRLQASIEVWKQVDLLSHVRTRSKNSWNRDADVWLCVIADHHSVHKSDQQRVLVRCRVRHEQCLRVLVT